MAEEKKMNAEERVILMNAMKGYVQSLMRQKTKEGDSDIGQLLDVKIAKARAMEIKVITKELF